MNGTTEIVPEDDYSEYEDDYTQYPEYYASVWVWKIFPPILILLGTVGNILSIIVLAHKKMRDSTVAVYLIVLSVADILVLYTGLFRQWLREVTGVDIRLISEVSCKIHIWIVYFSLDMSSWVLVSVTVERFVAVWFPYKVKHHCTRISACIIIGVVGTALLALNCHYLYGLGDLTLTSNGETSTELCTALYRNYDHFEAHIWPWIDLCAFSLIPLTILLIANISIVYRILQSRRAVRRVSPAAIATTSRQVQGRAKKISSLTTMLLVVSVVFFACNVPISIYLIAEPYWMIDSSPHRDAVLSLIWTILNVLMYTNNSINFLMYSISGSRFRETLKSIFHRNRQTQQIQRNSKMKISVIDAPSCKNAGNENRKSPQITNQSSFDHEELASEIVEG